MVNDMEVSGVFCAEKPVGVARRDQSTEGLELHCIVGWVGGVSFRQAQTGILCTYLVFCNARKNLSGVKFATFWNLTFQIA